MNVEQMVLAELQSLNGKLAGIQQGQELLKVELLGREGAPEHGRLPKVEAGISDHEKRITRLEKAYFIAGVVVGAMGMKTLAPLAGVLVEVLKGH
jgi:hypothetical protein